MAFNKCAKWLAIMVVSSLLGTAITACDSDNNGNGNPTGEITVLSTSIVSGDIVSDTITSIKIAYSEQFVLNSRADITLNDTKVEASTGEGNTLIIPVALSPDRNYSLVVPTRAVAGLLSKQFAPEVTVNFSTNPLPPVAVGDLTNASATPKTKAVYDFMVANYGKKIISGAMANVNNNNDFPDWLKRISGKAPAFICYDFIHLASSPSNWIDYSDITPAKTQWDAHGLVGYMWHWQAPDSEEAWRDKDTDKYGARVPGDNVEGPTSFDIREALKEGTWQHEFILSDIDRVAETLAKLQELDIPVIWRPMHEAAGSYRYDGAWFWWGRYGDEYTIKLWRLMHDRLVNHHRLNNLIWVWTAQYEKGFENQMAASYPGDDVVDVIGVDLYEDNDNSQVEAFKTARSMGNGAKLITLSETGRIPDPAKCMADGAGWSWFTLWYTYDIHKTDATVDGFGNTQASLTSVMSSPYVITLDQMPAL